jgi:antitoxin HigA-1
MKKIQPIHPGEILLEEFLNPLGVSQYRLAKDTSVHARRINEIVHGTRSITADTALRLGRFFGTSAKFWLNLQTHFNLEVQKEKIGDRLDNEVHALADAWDAQIEADATAGKLDEFAAEAVAEYKSGKA